MKFTKEQIQRSIESGYLSLERSDLLHYLQVGVVKTILYEVGLIAAVVATSFFSGRLNDAVLLPLIVLVTAGVIAFLILVTAVKIYSLKLETIPTRYTAKEIRGILTLFARRYHFKRENNRKDLIIVITRVNDVATHMRNERITILIQDQKIHAASICNPHGPFFFRSLLNRKANLNLLRAMLSGSRKPEGFVEEAAARTTSDS